MLLSNFIDAFIFFVFIFFQVGLLDPKWVEERDKQITQKVKIKSYFGTDNSTLHSLGLLSLSSQLVCVVR